MGPHDVHVDIAPALDLTAKKLVIQGKLRQCWRRNEVPRTGKDASRNVETRGLA